MNQSLHCRARKEYSCYDAGATYSREPLADYSHVAPQFSRAHYTTLSILLTALAARLVPSPMPTLLHHTPQSDTALTEGFISYGARLKNYATTRTHNSVMSDDLVQETFLKTWKFIVKGGDIKIMEAFLYHVLNGLIIDEYRKRKPVSLDLLLERGFEPGDDSRERLVDTLDGRRAILLIKELHLNYRRVMQMRFVQDLSLAEISLLTGTSKNTVAVQIHRGVAKLRTLYQGEVPDSVIIPVSHGM